MTNTTGCTCPPQRGSVLTPVELPHQSSCPLFVHVLPDAESREEKLCPHGDFKPCPQCVATLEAATADLQQHQEYLLSEMRGLEQRLNDCISSNSIAEYHRLDAVAALEEIDMTVGDVEPIDNDVWRVKAIMERYRKGQHVPSDPH